MLGDFHLHSHHSDGRLDPVALVDAVADAGVEVLALTDHDTTAGHASAARRSQERGVRFVPGIEMTCYGCERVVHVLGLGLRSGDEDLRTANEIAAQVWDRNQCSWVQALEPHWHVSVERDFPDHPVRLPVLIERLCLRGVEGGDPLKVHAMFSEFFAHQPPLAHAGLPSPAQAAAIVRQAGGIALLAHPLALFEEGLLEPMLEDGFDGLEAVYLRYTAEQREALCAVANRRGLLYSVGSDYHGYLAWSYRHPPSPAPEALLQRLGL